MIDEDHQALRSLADELQPRQRAHPHQRLCVRTWPTGKEPFACSPGPRPAGGNGSLTSCGSLRQRYRWAERRWDSPVAAEIGRRSVAQWLDAVNADAELRATAQGLRGFFLADPDELSLLPLVDQFASDDQLAPGKMYRIEGGNDRIAVALRSGTRRPSAPEHGVAGGLAAGRHHSRNPPKRPRALPGADRLPGASRCRRRCCVACRSPRRSRCSSTRRLPRLNYGRCTRTLLQFNARFWRSTAQATRFRLFAADRRRLGRRMRISAARRASCRCSREDRRATTTAELVERDGVNGLVRALDWLGSGNADLLAWRQTRWESDPWSRGGYAVFDPAFKPALRAWLARPCGRLFFAGEHTSVRWQGYMNGAVESGHRAAAEDPRRASA